MEVQVTSMEVIKITQLTLHKLERDSWVESKESRNQMQVINISSTSLRQAHGIALRVPAPGTVFSDGQKGVFSKPLTNNLIISLRRSHDE
jgi:hypothetical protein